MRTTAHRLLAQGTAFPRYDDLQDMLLLLRGHLALIVPETEALARSLCDRHTAHGPALAAVASARERLTAGPGSGPVSAVEHARSLAHELRTLCGHYATLRPAQTGQPA